MKAIHFFSRLLATAMFALVGAVMVDSGQAVAQTNLLQHGDFETWTGTNPDNWTSTNSASTAILKQSTDAHSGSYSVNVAAVASDDMRLAYKEIRLKAGKYTIQFYAKGGKCRAGYVPTKDDGTLGIYSYGGYVDLKADEWTLVSHDFELSAQTTVNILATNPRTDASKNYEATEMIIDDFTLTTANGGRLADPTSAQTAQFRMVTSVTSGKQYLIVAENGVQLYAAQPVPASKSYNYLTSAVVTASGDVITADPANAFTLVYNKGAYKIQQPDGRLLWMDDSHNSFQCAAAPTDGFLWSFEPAPTGSGIFTIRNVSRNKWVQLSTANSNTWGSYPETKEGGVMPKLYELIKGIPINGINYYFNNSEAVVAGLVDENCEDITIPTFVTYNNKTYPVTTIDKYAFYGCTNLKKILIPYSVTSVGKLAFAYCTALTEIIVEEGNSIYDSRKGCNAIIQTASNKLITGCMNTIIPNSVANIEEGAFYGCSGLTSVTIPNSVTSIGSSAFYGCSELTSINIPNSVTTIGKDAFMECEGLTNLSIGNGVTNIESGAFRDCTSLTSINIPSSVTSIGEDAFRNCSSLTSINIPSSVTSIGKYAFYDCTNLTSVTLNSDAIVSKKYTSSSSLSSIFGSQVTHYVIGDNVAGIGDYTFYGCANLACLTLSESLTEIGNGSFDGCSQAKLYVQKGGHVILLLWEKGYDGYDATTTEFIPRPTLSVINATQCTVTFSLENKDDTYDYKIDEIIVDNTNEIKLTGLKAQNVGTANLYAYWRTNDKWHEIGNCQYTTAEIAPTAAISTTASSITLVPSYIQGDATVTLQTLKFNGNTQDVEAGKAYFFNGLNPNKYYYITYTISADGYNYTYTKDIRCATLTISTQQPKVISAGNVIVSAETNLDEAETNVGFEWRRTDWTDDFNSNTGGAYLYQGTMEGYIRNLNTEKLWKYRPYYEASDGQRFYGNWVGIDPTNMSFFDPTVHTYSNINVQGNTASVKGYAMRGTDNITEQGFKYWKSTQHTRSFEGAKLMGADIPADAQTVVASGQVMTATLTGLDYETDYICVAFVTTSEGETFYGEQQVFHTGIAPTGISEVIPDESASSEHNVVGYYNVHGQRLSEPQRGVNIIRYSDGTSKKVIMN